MITTRNIDRVIARLTRLVRQWEEPVVARYRRDPFTTLISCLLSLRTQDATTAAAEERGRGAGQGMIVNVPLAASSGDDELLQAFDDVLLPEAMRFAPELILISAGFDAHRDDPLAGFEVTEEGYAQLTARVCEIARRCCEDRIVSVLEGGYHLEVLGRSVEAHLRVLIERTLP